MKPLIALVLILGLAACGPKLPSGVERDRLAQAVGERVGDPGTCVVLAEAGSGKVLWESAKSYVCLRNLPSCTTADQINVEGLASRPSFRSTDDARSKTQ